jgi:hypothetical protein
MIMPLIPVMSATMMGVQSMVLSIEESMEPSRSLLKRSLPRDLANVRATLTSRQAFR